MVNSPQWGVNYPEITEQLERMRELVTASALVRAQADASVSESRQLLKQANETLERFSEERRG